MNTEFKEEDILAAAAEAKKYPNKFELTDRYDMALSERIQWSLAKLRRKLHAGGGGGGDDDDDDDDDDMPSLERIDAGFGEETKNDILEALMGIYGESIKKKVLELILEGCGYEIDDAIEVSHPHMI